MGKGLSDKARLAKNKQIGKTRQETRARRAQKQCATFHFKIATDKNQEALAELYWLFNQAKWVRNYILGLENVDDFDDKIKSVPVRTPWGVEERPLTLGSQVKQGVYDQIKSDIRSLAALKKKRHSIGKLKFAREVNSVNLKQAGSTYRFNKRMTRVKIQGLKQWYRVRGANQLRGLKRLELANGKLLKKADGVYLAVTVYFTSDETDVSNLRKSLGVDFGLKTNLTLSDGREFDVRIEETDRLKRLQRKLQRQQKGSVNRYKTRMAIRKEYQKLDNRKNDASAKIVSKLLGEAQVIYFQDDNFNGWKNGAVKGGRTIQHSILGRVKTRMDRDDRFLKVDRYAPTTRTCVCGAKNYKLKLSDRWFRCEECGYTAPRDQHAAAMMETFYTPVERGEAPVEGAVGLSVK